MVSLTLILTLESLAGYGFFEFERGETGEVRGGDEAENRAEFPV